MVDEIDPVQAKQIQQAQERIAQAEKEKKDSFVQDRKKDEQREIFSRIMHKTVFDIIEFVDDYGDDKIAVCYAEKKSRDFVSGQEVIVQLINIEQSRIGNFFIEAVFKAGKLWDKKTGQNVMIAARQGEYG